MKRLFVILFVVTLTGADKLRTRRHGRWRYYQDRCAGPHDR